MWLQDLFKKIGEFFGWKPKTVSTRNIAKKKFLIKNKPESKSRFRIISEKKVPRNKKGKINILNESMPWKCPRCRSQGTICKTEKIDEWECNIKKGGCGFKW